MINDPSINKEVVMSTHLPESNEVGGHIYRIGSPGAPVSLLVRRESCCSPSLPFPENPCPDKEVRTDQR